MTDLAKVAIVADTSSLAKATTNLKNFQKVGATTSASITRSMNGMTKSFQAARVPVQTTAKALSVATPKMKSFGNSARQVSMQLSQVAQQGSVTGNYFQALAIQLPDLALGFGTMGILIGAVAGALAMPLIAALKGAGGELEKFNEEVRDGTVDLERLGEAQKLVFARDQLIKISETKDAIADYTSEIADSQAELDRLNKITASWGMSQFEIDRLTKKATESLQDSTAARELENKKLKEQQDLLEQVNKGVSAETARKQAEEILAIRTQLVDNLESLENKYKSPAQRAFEQMAEEKNILSNAYSADIIDFQAYKDQKALIDEQYSKESIARAEKDAAKKNQILSAGQTAGLGVLAGALGQAAALAKEGGEKQFKAYKALAIAQATVSTALAVAGILSQTATLGLAAIPLAATVGVLGAVQIGMIANQEYQGARAMGGQVEAGGRFLVGENGPEVLQLGSQGGNVTPNHALGGGGGASVTNVFNIQAGVTKQEVAGLIPTIVNATKQAVQSDMSKGGTMSQSIGRRA